MENDVSVWVPKLQSLVSNLSETTEAEAQEKKELSTALHSVGELVKTSDNPNSRRQTIAFAQ